MEPSPAFTDNALLLLKKRYLQPKETPEGMLERVSGGNKEFYDMMARLDFLPNSPTLFNMGTGQGTLAACFKFDVQDTMESIMDVARKAAMVLKWGGGIGYYLGNLRPRGSPIASTHKKACGPVSVLRHYQSISDMITQGGKRNGAQMGILNHDHSDIKEFIHCKNGDPQSLNTFNISVSVTDAFMRAVERGDEEESILWCDIVSCAWTTGDPGLYFVDHAERDNPTPHLGKLTGTNPCGEVPLLDNEACNIGSINLSNFAYGENFDWDALDATIRTAVRFLDSIIDKNSFPTPEISDAVAATRKIGLGVMGWADALALLRIDYDTQEAVGLGYKVMEFIKRRADTESYRLGHEKGSYPTDQSGRSFRNATRTCIAPTGSISLLAGCSSGIEPHYSLEWDRVMGDDDVLHERIPVIDKCGGFIPKTAHDIDWRWHLLHQAAFQAHTDLAASKTVNLSHDATEEDISNSYMWAWKLGCKGVTAFRDGCRENGEQVLIPSGQTSAKRHRLPDERESKTHKFTVGNVEGYLTAGCYDDGSPGELFITVSKEGSTVRGLSDAVGMLSSLNLQHGVPLQTITDKLAGTRFEPSGLTANPDIPTASSIMDYTAQWLAKTFSVNGSSPEPSGMLCPECGTGTIYEGGCLTCPSSTCDWSRCG